MTTTGPLITLVLALALAACATPPAANEGADAAGPVTTEKVKVVERGTEDAVVCNYESVTGSHRKTRVCRTVAQRESERESGQAVLRRIQKVGTKPIN